MVWGDLTRESEEDNEDPSGKSEVAAVGPRPPCRIFSRVAGSLAPAPAPSPTTASQASVIRARVGNFYLKCNTVG